MYWSAVLSTIDIARARITSLELQKMRIDPIENIGTSVLVGNVHVSNQSLQRGSIVVRRSLSAVPLDGPTVAAADDNMLLRLR
jgi:hypothetical protein